MSPLVPVLCLAMALNRLGLLEPHKHALEVLDGHLAWAVSTLSGCLRHKDGAAGATSESDIDAVRLECTRLQQLLASSNQHRLQLQAALLTVQQEHRILLQKVHIWLPDPQRAFQASTSCIWKP